MKWDACIFRTLKAEVLFALCLISWWGGIMTRSGAFQSDASYLTLPGVALAAILIWVGEWAILKYRYDKDVSLIPGKRLMPKPGEPA